MNLWQENTDNLAQNIIEVPIKWKEKKKIQADQKTRGNNAVFNFKEVLMLIANERSCEKEKASYSNALSYTIHDSVKKT